MKIKCRLYGRDLPLSPITETEIEANEFCASAENPFPASHLFAAAYCPKSLTFMYQVDDVPSWEDA